MYETILKEENFNKEVVKSDLPVLVDFWATWCGPCMRLSPVIAAIAKEYEGKIKVCKVNVDEQPALAAKFNIVNIPTVIAFKDGTITNSMIGLRSKEQLLSMVI